MPKSEFLSRSDAIWILEQILLDCRKPKQYGIATISDVVLEEIIKAIK